MNMNKCLFTLGTIVATPGCIEALEKLGVLPVTLLARHVSGDWGDVCELDRASNDQAVKDNTRIFSVYRLADEVTVWIITEADRSSTCLLLPYEY